jgi:hypothetical protein
MGLVFFDPGLGQVMGFAEALDFLAGGVDFAVEGEELAVGVMGLEGAEIGDHALVAARLCGLALE